jgi:hypothetical protein
LPFRRLVLGLRQLCDVGPGILERDEIAAAGDFRVSWLDCTAARQPGAEPLSLLPPGHVRSAALEVPFRGVIGVLAIRCAP